MKSSSVLAVHVDFSSPDAHGKKSGAIRARSMNT